MDNPNLEELLQMGISAAKRGDRQGARMLLKQVLEGDKKNDRALIWMAYVSKDKSERKRYLETALQVNPNNKTARMQLRKMSAKQSFQEQKTLVLAGVFTLTILVFAAFLCVIVLIAS